MPTNVLAHAQIFPTLGEAVEDCHLTVGTTCRGGPYRESVLPLRECSIELAEASAANRIAMIFGTEDTGLTNRELKFCQKLITIPTLAEYASINLAQAVILCAYELRMALGMALASEPRASAEPQQLASATAVDAAMERLKESLLSDWISPRGKSGAHHVHASRNFRAHRSDASRTGNHQRDCEHTKWAAEGGHETLAAKRAAGKKLR